AVAGKGDEQVAWTDAPAVDRHARHRPRGVAGDPPVHGGSDVGDRSSLHGPTLDVIAMTLPGPPPALHASRSGRRTGDRKSTRLNSSHVAISYAVFCLKK